MNKIVENGLCLTSDQASESDQSSELARLGEECVKVLMQYCLKNREEITVVLEMFRGYSPEQVMEIVNIATETENRVRRVIADFEAQKICNEIYSVKEKDCLRQKDYIAGPVETALMERMLKRIAPLTIFSASDLEKIKACQSLANLERMIEQKIASAKRSKECHLNSFWKERRNWTLLPLLDKLLSNQDVISSQ